MENKTCECSNNLLHKIDLVQEFINGKLLDITEAECSRINNEDLRVKNENSRKDAECERVTNEETRQDGYTKFSRLEDLYASNEKGRLSNELDRINSETIREHAENCRKNAETFRQEFEKSRLLEENKRVASEITRINNESSRITIENNRVISEDNRKAAEDNRIEAEHNRVSNEDSRIISENLRINNENLRKLAEEARASVEQSRVDAEKGRVANEEVRKSNEQTRQSQESARGEAENARQACEQARKDTESERSTAEAARKDAETKRASAEAARVKAENARQTANQTLQENIDAEGKARQTADQTLQENIDAEIQAEIDRATAAENAILNNITQTTGNSTTSVMSQKAVTDELNKINVFDISAYHATGGTLATYDNLEDALGTNGKNIPQSLRKGGMSVKFVQTSDNKYVQYRYMSTSIADANFTNVANWICVDKELNRVPFSIGQYIDENGNILKHSDFYVTECLALKNLEIISVKLKTNGPQSLVNYIAFYDEDWNFIEGVNGSSSVTIGNATYIVTFPQNIDQNAKYVRFCSRVSSPEVYAKDTTGNGAGASFLIEPFALLNDYKKKVNDRFSAIEDFVDMIPNSYIDNAGDFKYTSGDSIYYRTTYFRTKNLVLTKLDVNTNGNTPTLSYIAFYDSELNLVSNVQGTSAGGHITTIPTIPSGATYMALCSSYAPILLNGYYSVSTNKISLSKFSCFNEMQKKEKEISLLSYITGQYIDGNGVVVSTPNQFIRTGYIKLSRITVNTIKLRIRNDVSYLGYISFYDSNFNFLSKVDGSTAVNNYITTFPSIPSGAAYLMMCAWEEPIIIDGTYNNTVPISNIEYANVGSDDNYIKIADKAVFIGDSISSVLGGSYGAPVGQLLQDWGVISNVEIMAQAGTQITSGITQINNATTVNPDIVFVAFGVNDWTMAQVDGVGEWFTESTVEGVTKRTYDTTSNTIKARFNKLYAAIKTKYPLARVIMQTVIKKGDNSREQGGQWLSSPDYFTKSNVSNLYLDEIRSVVLDMPRVCNVEAMDMWQVSGLDPTIASNKTAYFVDFTHPNADGHILMANAMYKYLISH